MENDHVRKHKVEFMLDDETYNFLINFAKSNNISEHDIIMSGLEMLTNADDAQWKELKAWVNNR